MGNRIKIGASLLAAEFTELSSEIKRAEDADVDFFHLDIMDGHFVPNITIGPFITEQVSKITELDLSVHLMIENPEKFIKPFIQAGASLITFHIEPFLNNEKKVKEILLWIKKSKIKAGIAINPDTSVSTIKTFLEYLDLALVMSVYPGFGGQKFIHEVLTKIEALRKVYDKDIEVDGGINENNAKKVLQAGANVLVAGTYIFKARDIKEAVNKLRR